MSIVCWSVWIRWRWQSTTRWKIYRHISQRQWPISN